METECASREVRARLQVLLQVASILLLQVASISQLTVRRLSRQYGILNISQSCTPPRPITGIALHFYILLTYNSENYKYTYGTERNPVIFGHRLLS
jgi:hypothetical protein